MTATETVSLIRARDSDVWHVLNDDADAVLCKIESSWSYGDVVVEVGLDARVVQYRGKRVCSRCRRRIA